MNGLVLYFKLLENNSIYNSLKKKIQIVAITREVKDIYNEYYKPLRKEIKQNFTRRKDCPCSWISRVNIVKMTMLPRQFIYLMKSPSKF
jgi:hypothetical protein